MRDGLRALLDRESDIHVVGDVCEVGALVETVRREQPDVVVLGEGLFREAGRGLTRALEALTPAVEVLVVTGAEQSFGAVMDHIRALGRAMASRETGSSPEALDAETLYALLSPRETEVLRMIASGYTNQEAARRFGISVKTVEGYRARLMRKLGVRGRAGLVRIALDCGLLSSRRSE